MSDFERLIELGKRKGFEIPEDLEEVWIRRFITGLNLRAATRLEYPFDTLIKLRQQYSFYFACGKVLR